MQSLTTLHAVRSAKVDSGLAKSKKTPTLDSPRESSHAAPNNPSTPVKGSATTNGKSKPNNSSRFFRIPVFWNQIVEFRGLKVYRRNDLIDPNFVDLKGRTNLQRMKTGLAPIGKDNESIELHLLIQMDDGPVAEILHSFHVENRRVLHINPSSIPSGIEEAAWKNWRRAYWRKRAKDFT